MLITFQIIMLLITVITFIGSVGEKDDKTLRNNLTAICIASIIGFISATWFL